MSAQRIPWSDSDVVHCPVFAWQTEERVISEFTILTLESKPQITK